MTSQHGNENNMEVAGGVVYQGEFYKLNESRKRLLGTKTGTWKIKYLIFRHKSEKPVLELHKKKPKSGKKPERTLTDIFELWPSYKVEKLQNARGREFVCEITSSNLHIFLSADSSKEIDVLVFLLQVQIRLKEDIQKDLIHVLPDDTECQHRIGAKGSSCVLHASPWGLTLALGQTKALLAQWPLKSIRYYETSGAGNFSIEAGRVAPMGEGLFSFKTQPGDDDYMYNLVDSYIVNTLDRVKPTQKGTPEEIEDYIHEHDCLHSLTTIILCSQQTPEISDVIRKNWSSSSTVPDNSAPSFSVESHSSTPTLRHQRNRVQTSESSLASSNRPTQSSSLVINLERPGESSSTDRGRQAVSASEFCVTDRPPPLPSRSTNSVGVPRRSQRRDHSIPRKVDVVSTRMESETQSGVTSPSSPRPRSNHSSVSQRARDSELVQPLGVSVAENGSTSHHTEFYNMSSPNMKVRVSKSPVVTKHPNKVGRAEYLLSLQQSGVRSPMSESERWESVSGPEDDHKEAAEYLDAVSRASHQKYGGNSSLERQQSKLRRDLSSGNQSVPSVYSCMDGPGDVAKLDYPNGYINLQNTFSREVHHSHQRSAPEPMYEVFAPQELNMAKKDDNQTSSPPILRHQRQRSLDELSQVSDRIVSELSISESQPQTSGASSRRSGESSRQVSVSTSRTDTRVSDSVSDMDTVERKSTDRQLSEFSGLDNVDGSVSEWLMSASCEDLSDHMRTVIYDDNVKNEYGDVHEDLGEETSLSKLNENHQVASSMSSVSSGDKPPLPFTGLKKFHDHTGTVAYSRDRSKSFGYMNIPGSVGAAQIKSQSSAPSAHLIRKMVNARAKQETLRKSLSNPNFLNLGSKEHLCNLKASGGSNNKLANQKQKSKSFGSLFPAIKKALSRDSLGHSRSTTPERRSSRSTTPERRSSFSFRRRNSDVESNFKRDTNFHSYGEMTIKGIRMSERSRSFRRVRAARSVEVLSKSDNDAGPSLSIAPMIPPPTASETNNITSDLNTAPPASTSTSVGTSASISNPVSTDAPPATAQSPPIPAPRKAAVSDGISTFPPKAPKSSSSSHRNSQPYQNIARSEHEKTTQNETRLKKPAINNFTEEPRQHRSHPALTSVSSGTETANQRRSRADSSLSASGSKTTNQRATSLHQGSESQGNRTSSATLRTSSSQPKAASDSRQTQSEHIYHCSAQKEITSSVSQQGSDLSDERTNSINQSNNLATNSKSGESNPKLPSPFQPIPFRKQTNGIRSVKAPSKPAS